MILELFLTFISFYSFAGNAKKIKNQPKVNETISNKVIMNRLLKDIEDLKKELERERNRNAAVSRELNIR